MTSVEMVCGDCECQIVDGPSDNEIMRLWYEASDLNEGNPAVAAHHPVIGAKHVGFLIEIKRIVDATYVHQGIRRVHKCRSPGGCG
jgi:hypothetical protein